MTDEQDHWDALAALLEAGNLAGRVFDYDTVPGESGVPGTVPEFYALLSVERRPVDPDRAGGGTSATGWRATVRYVDTTAENARRVGGWVTAAFEVTPGRGKRITVDGVTSTRIAHETTQAVDRDEGRFSGSVTYTYAL